MTEHHRIERSQIRAIRAKAETLTRWLSEHAPYCETSQKHLDQATVEQAYWHYGYVCAIQDILAIVDSESTR
jgi:hypothetical protein